MGEAIARALERIAQRCLLIYLGRTLVLNRQSYSQATPHLNKIRTNKALSETTSHELSIYCSLTGTLSTTFTKQTFMKQTWMHVSIHENSVFGYNPVSTGGDTLLSYSPSC